MGRDIIVLGSLALLSTMFFSFILVMSVLSLPFPFLLLVIPLCLGGQIVAAFKIDDFAERMGYKFHS